ncbi:MAG: DAHL domain-containing protein [Polyangiaceae bacterium]
MTGSWVLRGLWCAGLAATIGLGVSVVKASVDPVVHDHYSRDIREMAALDALLDGQIMQSRQGLVNHFDDVVHTVSSLELLHRRLQIIPSYLSSPAKRELTDLIARLGESLDAKESSIERFKSENAVLRNSVHFFPVGALELRDALDEGTNNTAAARAVNDLLCTVLRYNAQPSDALRASAEGELARLLVDEVPAATKEDIAIVTSHAATVLERRATVDALTNEILELPTRGRIDAIDVTYARTFQSAVRAVEARRVVLFVVVFITAALVAADIILHLRRLARKLATANVRLRREKERERELADLKNRFVSMTSHEFRTPLSVILSSAELLEAYGDQWSASKKADHLTRIRDAVRGMTRLLDGVLVIGRADANRLVCSPSRLDLERYCNELVDAVEPTLSPKHNLDLRLVGLREVSLDEKLLNHILTNLLSNAVKYSPDGGTIRFEATCEPDRVRFIVEDEGIGVSKEDVPHLFESFHRGSNVGHIPGTGLGLAVVRRSVDAHGGTLDVHSEEGRGTTFEVVIPLLAS